MTETKHTPGPWSVIPPDENSKSWFVGRDRLGASIGTVPEHFKDDRTFYVCCFRYFPIDDAEANANLIAAAPDMYEVLEDLLKYKGVMSDESVARARSAIAKARGEK